MSPGPTLWIGLFGLLTSLPFSSLLLRIFVGTFAVGRFKNSLGEQPSPHVSRHASGRTVVDEADLAAVQKLGRFLGKYGIEVHDELIQPDGYIDLDRDGLVVICGPKSSTVIRHLMGRDDVVRFEHDEEYWYLADQSNAKNYYSLRATKGLNSDIGYISRTERSAASSKKFLSIAGFRA